MRDTSRDAIIPVNTRVAPPYWALLECQLIDAQARACKEFFAHYFDERGYQRMIPRWGGDDGPDDAAENVLNWPMLHALGAPDYVLDLYKLGWEGHLKQYTEAKTIETSLGRSGMYYKEFPVMFDWFHTGEGLNAFVLQGLSDPHDRDYQTRVRRFAGFYMNEDPQAPNYDPQHRIIRSMFNGSRGPLMRPATGLDWAGDPIEVEGRFSLRHSERTFQEMLDHFKDYNDIVGDNPLNLGATTLAFNAYALTGEAKYREWLLEYVDAWVERTEANGGIVPSNIGLDGTIGGTADGKWYGGVYGWGFTVTVPGSGALAHRPHFYHRAHYGFGNALLLTGNPKYGNLWKRTIELVNANAKDVAGQTLYPRMYGDQGWYDYRPEPFGWGALESYYWTLDREFLKPFRKPAWIAFLDGERPDFPVEALTTDLDSVGKDIAILRADPTSADTRLSDESHGYNPVLVENLNRLMLGGLPTSRVGYPLHSWVRYFDPERRRAGVPEGVGALVESMSETGITLHLVNTDALTPKTVVVQGGAYAEHQIQSVQSGELVTPVNHSHFVVRLAPGAGERLTLTMRRYANQPTFAFPWA